jgi:predicted DNA-binding protein (UPF0251 family)
MPRKKCHRHIDSKPGVTFYKPAGIPMHNLEEVVLHIDEFEALRLADAEGLYHEEAAARMNISRATFGRIVGEARKKIAIAITEGKAIVIESFVLNSNHKINSEDDKNSCTNTRRES